MFRHIQYVNIAGKTAPQEVEKEQATLPQRNVVLQALAHWGFLKAYRQKWHLADMGP